MPIFLQSAAERAAQNPVGVGMLPRAQPLKNLKLAVGRGRLSPGGQRAAIQIVRSRLTGRQPDRRAEIGQRGRHLMPALGELGEIKPGIGNRCGMRLTGL